MNDPIMQDGPRVGPCETAASAPGFTTYDVNTLRAIPDRSIMRQADKNFLESLARSIEKTIAAAVLGEGETPA